MKMSACIELVWQGAGQEAIATGYGEIRPDHFFLSLLKLAELPIEEIGVIPDEANAARELAREVKEVREGLAARSITGPDVRQIILKQIGSGDTLPQEGTIHRSAASRALFDAAARHAEKEGSQVLRSGHLLHVLLESPTSAISAVMGGPGSADSPSPTPLLDLLGKPLSPSGERKPLLPNMGAGGRALQRAIAQEGMQSVFLVSSDRDLAAGVLLIAAADLAESRKTGRRFIDISDLEGRIEKGPEGLDLIEQLFDEASSVRGIVLCGPPVESDGDGEFESRWLEALKIELEKKRIQLVCRIEPAAYEDLTRKDPQWKRLAQAMWLQRVADLVPDEL